jgi:large subunit ribosomal protein L21
MYAVVKTGGKQYRVAANDLLSVEKLNGAPGDIVELGEVLMVGSDGGIEVGSPLLAGASVAAEIVDQIRSDRIIVFKKRRRHHYRRRNGHRQDLTRIRITEILTGGARPSAKAKPEPAEAAPLPEIAVETGVEPAAEPETSGEPAAKPGRKEAKARPRAKPKSTTGTRTSRKPPAKRK